MKTRFSFISLVSVASFLFSNLLVSLPASAASAVATFQQGMNGYTGAQDLFITNQYGEWSGGNGRAETAGDLGSYAVSGNGYNSGYEMRSILRFQNLALPPGAVVKSAALTLTFNNWETDFSLQGEYVATGWDYNFADLGWVKKDANSQWAVPGAGGVGSDVLAGTSFAFTGFAGKGTETLTAALDPGVVQDWIDEPTSHNRGIRLRNTKTDKVVWIYSAEASNLAYRPKLSITYDLSGDPTPPPPPPISQPPVAPTELTAKAVSVSRIDLVWSDLSSDEKGFLIERKIGANGTYAQIAQVGANVKSFSNTGLSASTAYVYRVRSYNDAGKSSYSNESGATTLAAATKPTAPTGLKAVAISSSQVNLSWTDTSTNETGFKIERKVLGKSYTQIATVGANVTSFSSTGLAANTSYVYRVRAYNAKGNSAYSNEVTAKTLTLTPPADTQPPTISLVEPLANATLSGIVNFTAAASDNTGVAGVMFKVDGVALGTEDTASPYTVSFNSATVQDGPHTIAAVARDTSNNTATASININVQNTVVVPPPLPPPTGLGKQVSVQLVPHASVVGSQTTVSFGLPLPPGLLTSDAQVVVKNASGEEIPAYVHALLPWRSIPPSLVQCAGLPTGGSPGISSVLIQFPYTFTSVNPVTVSVVLNVSRTKDIATQVPVAQTFRLANEGTYVTADGIYEPRVYAVLPPAWLACTGISSMGTVSGAQTALSSYDTGQKNFVDTILNQFSPNPDPSYLTNYKTDYEPWLYDRAQAFYAGYARTGDVKFLREGTRAAYHYGYKLLFKSGECPTGIPDQWCRGFMKMKNPADYYYKDSKYSYAESLANYYRLTGDAGVVDRIKDVVSATKTEIPLTNYPVADYFDERHWAFALMAPIIGYEVTGDQAMADYAKAGVDAMYKLQQNSIEGKPKNGCFNSHVEGAAEVSFSPWMSSLMAASLLRGYYTLADTRVPGMLTDLAQCELTYGIYFPTENGAPQYWMPRYIAASYTPKSLDGDPWSDFEHSVDVAYVTALGAYFSPSATQKSALIAATNNLLASHAYALEYWTRPGMVTSGWPLYRVNPPRKYAWWYKNTGSIGWGVYGATMLP